ncbi:MAG: hypothetical protein AAB580_01740, partial [Patescibacteria group bacterium]
MRKLKFNIIGLVGLSFLTASLVVAVGVTNNPVQKFIVDSWAKGRCVDKGRAAARNECIAGEKEAMEDIQKQLTQTGITTAPKFKDLKLLQQWVKAQKPPVTQTPIDSKLEDAEKAFLSKVDNGSAVVPPVKTPVVPPVTTSVINEKEKIAERDKLEAQRLANEAKDIAVAEAKKQRLDEIRDRD